MYRGLAVAVAGTVATRARVAATTMATRAPASEGPDGFVWLASAGRWARTGVAAL
jgi:hypothetical protein